MRKYLSLIFLVLGLCSCTEERFPSHNEDHYLDQEFGMNCVGVVDGFGAAIYFRCENEEAICYAGYDGKTINCKWKGESK